MTGPRVDPPGADKRGTPIIPRVLTGDEWEQAQGMSTKSLATAPFPTQPPVWKPDTAARMGALKDGAPAAAPRDVTRTPSDVNAPGKPMPGIGGVLARQVVNPVIEHPWMTAGVLGANLIPVVGPVVNLALMGDMASNIALYGYQKHLENVASPDARKILEDDPERISGEAAAVQAVMLGLGPLIYKGVKGYKNLDVSKGMVEAGAKGLKEMPLGPDFAPDTPPTLAENAFLNKRFAAKLAAGAKRQGSPRDVAPVEGLEPTGDQARLTSTPRHPSGYAVDNPFAPEAVRTKPVPTDAPGDALARAAEQANDPMRPKRRPAPQLSTNGAELLGSVAARNGLEVESNPFPPKSPNGTAWKNGHVEGALDAEPLPSYPEGFAMGGIEGRIPDVPAPKLPKVDVPEGATVETAQAALDLKPSKFRTHTTDELANAALDAQKAIEEAQAGIERARQRGLVGETAQADLENRGVSFSDESEMSSLTQERALGRAKAKMAQIEREFALRGVAGDDLAGVMQGAKEIKLEREAMAQEEALAVVTERNTRLDAAQEAAKVPRPERPPDPMEIPLNRTVEGTGATKTRGLSANVEAKAVANRLMTGLDTDLPQYQQVSMAEQATKATDLLANDPALARRIALGEAPPPEGLLPESVFVAVENKAIADGDVATIRELATGRLTSEATTMGQRIRALGERDPESPVAAIKSVIEVRMGGVKNVPKATAETIATIRAQLAKSTITQKTWHEFVSSLRC